MLYSPCIFSIYICSRTRTALSEEGIKSTQRLVTSLKNVHFDSVLSSPYQAMKHSYEDLDFRLDGGEIVREAQDRSLPIIFEIIKNKAFTNVAIGNHGNIMTSILNYFDNTYGYAFWKSTEKPDIYKLTFNGFHLISVTKKVFKF